MPIPPALGRLRQKDQGHPGLHSDTLSRERERERKRESAFVEHNLPSKSSNSSIFVAITFKICLHKAHT
jgi:hypothetical protein